MNEIEEFLKRAAAMRAQQKAAQTPAARPTPAPPAQPARLVPATPTRPAPLAPLSQRSSLDLVQDAEVIEAEEVTGDDVAEYVARHLDAGAFRERSSHLGESIKSSDEVIEAHLHQSFEHRLGQLGAATPRAEDSSLDEDELAAGRLAKPAPTPADIRSLLQSTQNLRNAIILSEILNPPTHRW